MKKLYTMDSSPQRNPTDFYARIWREGNIVTAAVTHLRALHNRHAVANYNRYYLTGDSYIL